MKKITMIAAVTAVALTGCGEPDFSGADMSDSAVKSRIAPVGMVNTGAEMNAEAAPAAAAPAAEAAPAPAAAPAARSGEAVYNTTCKTCHAGTLPTAPAMGDAAAWAPRAEKGIDALLTSAVSGTANGTPAKGLCMDCSDDELKAAIQYMLDNSK